MVKVGIKPRRRVRYAKRRPGKKLATVAKVKRLISGKAETKFYFKGLADKTLYNRKVYILQPFGQLQKGTSSDNRLGDKISDINMHWSCSWTATGFDALGLSRLNCGQSVRVMLVRSTRRIGHTIGGGTDAENGYGIFSTNHVPVFSDTDRLQLLQNPVQTVNSLAVRHSDSVIIKQFWIKSTNEQTGLWAGVHNFKMGTWHIPKYEFDANRATPDNDAAKYQYYVVVTTSANGLNPDGAYSGEFQFHYDLTYKDL